VEGIAMLKRSLTFILLLTLLLIPVPDGQALQPDPAPEPDTGAVVCPPGAYLSTPDDCLPLGPSEALTGWAAQGLPYPLRPLPAYDPDPALNYVPYAYFRVTENVPLPVYGSLTDARQGGSAAIYRGPGELVYVTYISRAETDNGVYYELGPGEWAPGEGSRVSYISFQGLRFSSTPANSFGWFLGDSRVRVAPGLSAQATGRVFYRYQMAQIYATAEADGLRWFLIGPGEWVEGRTMGRVIPALTPPPGVVNGRWIDINLEEQTLAIYDGGELVYATLIASGTDPYWTRPGLFQIYEKKESETMSGAFEADRSDFYYLEDVPWTMYFDGKRALHGAYWRTLFGYEQSHGCVNLSIGDSRWLYDWAREGDWVYVYDPSGRTPTDITSEGAP